MSAHVETPLGGKILTPKFYVLLAFVAAGALLVLYRLFYGLGAVSAMNDGYPWGIWKPLNVVTFTGIAAGAYAVGLLTYIFNKGEFHPLVRSAIVAGAMGYTLAGTSVLVDLGRWWNLWVLFWPPLYNMNSVLLEVAICVMAYTFVLWIEITPAILEYFQHHGNTRVRALAEKGSAWMKKLLPFIISLALLLPTMHQSSLGGLYMIAVTKLHQLWHTPWLSVLFLLSCLTMGYGSVVVIENLTDLVFHRRTDQKLLSRIAVVPMGLCLLYLVVRLGDLAYRHRLGLIARMDFYSVFFLVEMALFLAPALMLMSRRVRNSRSRLFVAASMLLLGGTLYRFDTYLVAYQTRPGWVYFPSVGELVFSLGLFATGVAVYVAIVKSFPILTGVLKTDTHAEHAYSRADISNP